MTEAPARDAVGRRQGGKADRPHDEVAARLPDGWSIAWILVILSLVLAAALTVAVGVPAPARQLVLIPFALLAPGMAVARLVRPGTRLLELALGVALGAGMAVVASGALLVLGVWDAAHVVVILSVVTLVALELDPRIPSRAFVWREYGSAGRRAIARGRAQRAGPEVARTTGGAPAASAPRDLAPTAARPPAAASTSPVESLPPPPVAVVRRGPRRAPVAPQPAAPGAKRQPMGENPLETPALHRHLRSTIHGVVDDLAARKDKPS